MMIRRQVLRLKAHAMTSSRAVTTQAILLRLSGLDATMLTRRIKAPCGLARYSSESAVVDANAVLAAMTDSLDNIDDSLRDGDLKSDAPWGMVIYRLSYSDDEAWRRMLTCIRTAIAERLELQDRSDLIACHSPVVVDDPVNFRNLGPDQVREKFAKWATEESERKWARKRDSNSHHLTSTRYNYCLMVDDLCLESFDKMAGAPFVKLLRKDFLPSSQDEARRIGLLDDSNSLNFPPGFWEDGVTNHEEEDVGWMYIPAVDYVDEYNRLCDGDYWYDSYVRPPFTFLNRRAETAIGFWRRKQ
ncbi:hypothetical protein F5Y11DRAFT_330589 [Daldinia sp. FL1419]|nr:hypothetical protein F5Y11DRAFT_330589 [Daldinia sp. FL1419]